MLRPSRRIAFPMRQHDLGRRRGRVPAQQENQEEHKPELDFVMNFDQRQRKMNQLLLGSKFARNTKSIDFFEKKGSVQCSLTSV